MIEKFRPAEMIRLLRWARGPGGRSRPARPRRSTGARLPSRSCRHAESKQILANLHGWVVCGVEVTYLIAAETGGRVGDWK